MTEAEAFYYPGTVRILRLHLTNFLSYREATLELGDLTALVGPNASGKSNAVAAFKLLREIPAYGLPTAIARRGGFDQLRHRSKGHPYDPAIRLDFTTGENAPESHYELRFKNQSGGRYSIKRESGSFWWDQENGADFIVRDGRVHASEVRDGEVEVWPASDRDIRLAPGQSAAGSQMTYAGALIREVLGTLQTVEINPAKIGELQEPSPSRVFEPDGSNTASIVDTLSVESRRQLAEQLAAIVPGIERIESRKLADKVTTIFKQFVPETNSRREFFAKQMSDGTLRAFGILLSMLQPRTPSLLIIEEPEVAIHLGALRTLVDVLRQQSEEGQVLITTHSADIVDTLEIESLRVVWTTEGASRISSVAEHTIGPIRQGLITPGDALRADALDPSLPA